MIIEFEVTKQDALDFNIFYLERLNHAEFIIRMLRYSMPFLIFIMLYKISWAFSIVIITFWIIFFPKYLARIVKNTAERRVGKGKANDFIGKKKIVLKNDCIEDIISTAISKIKYSEIDRIEQDNNHFYVFCSLTTIIIPFSAFTDLNQKKDFLNLFKQKVGEQRVCFSNEKPSKKIMITILCYGISFLIYVLVFFAGWEQNGDNFGYAFLNFYFIIPIISFSASLIINIKNGYLKWLYPFLFGVLGIAISIVIFPKMTWASEVWTICTIPAFIGSTIGTLILIKCKRRS